MLSESAEMISDSQYAPCYVDIWSLGVLLFYICCRTTVPWQRASNADPNFKIYTTQDTDYLYHHFPISQQLNQILKKKYLC